MNLPAKYQARIALQKAKYQARIALQKALLRLPLSRVFGSPYPPFMSHPRFNFTLPQLAFIGQLIEEATAVEGGILEIGCEGGQTTVFLNQWLDAIGVDRPYTAIDTFAGFTDEDIKAEHERGTEVARSPDLGASGSSPLRWFRGVTKESFDCRMQANGIRRVRSVQGDAVTLDYKSFAPICFALIDVDLYRPVKVALNAIDELVMPGGIIVVDDSAAHGLFAGAYIAYKEYCEAHALPLDIQLEKLGVIRKN